MTVKGNAENIETRARELFDDSVERIDGATRSRLTQARHAALAELDRPRLRLGHWVPVGALAAAAVLAVTLWTGTVPDEQALPVLAVAPAEDFEMLANGEDLDMLDEDVEFYAWAASADAGNAIG
jgi:hypothetical protein